jgi:hypothetical protein
VSQEQVIVSVADDQADDITTVVDALRGAGLTVTEVLDTVGVVTGTVSRDDLPSLLTVPGVADVERSRTYQVPPPDSPTQ